MLNVAAVVTPSSTCSGGPLTPATNTARWISKGLLPELAANLRRSRGPPPSQREPAAPPRRAASDAPPNALALVTGATGGIGSAICLQLASSGFDVIVAARNASAAAVVVDTIRASGGRATYERLDLDNATAADGPVALSQRLRGRPIALLVNNAGTMGGSVGQTLRVNCVGPVALTLALYPNLVAARGGACVINVGSSSHLRASTVRGAADSRRPDLGLGAYATSKLGLMHFSLRLRNAVGSRGTVRVVDAHPGMVWTPMLRGYMGEPACRALVWTGLSNRLFRTADEGAQAILAARTFSPDSTAASGAASLYFVDGRPSVAGASSESRRADAAAETWRWLVDAEPSLVDLARAVPGLDGPNLETR